jgi:hypothetical protein
MSSLMMNGIGHSGDAIFENLSAYWKLEETNGQTRVDSYVNGHDLTDNFGVESAVGKIGTAAHAANANEHLSAADHADLSPTTAFTISLWANFDALDGNRYIAQKGTDGGNRCIIMHARSTGAIRCYISDDGDNIPQINTAASTFTTATWYHIVFWYDGGQAVNNNRYKIYKDTVQVANSWGTLPTSLNDSGHAFTLSSLGSTLKGKLDEVGFWKRALTTAEIENLYNAGRGRSLFTS